jgi:hypothetical protein
MASTLVSPLTDAASRGDLETVQVSAPILEAKGLSHMHMVAFLHDGGCQAAPTFERAYIPSFPGAK